MRLIDIINRYRLYLVIIVGVAVLFFWSCSKDVSPELATKSKTLLMSHTMKIVDFHNLKYEVYITFTDSLLNSQGKRVRKVKLPQRKVQYRLDVDAPDNSDYSCRWLVNAVSQVHSFGDSIHFGVTDEAKLTSGKIIRPVKIVDHMPLLMGMDKVRHSLQIQNPNSDFIKLGFDRLLYSRSGRIIAQRQLSNPELLPPGEITKLILEDYIEPDILSETVTIVIDTVFHL